MIDIRKIKIFPIKSECSQHRAILNKGFCQRQRIVFAVTGTALFSYFWIIYLWIYIRAILSLTPFTMSHVVLLLHLIFLNVLINCQFNIIGCLSLIIFPSKRLYKGFRVFIFLTFSGTIILVLNLGNHKMLQRKEV